MEETGIFLIVLLAILLLLYFLKQQWSRRHFPPGPLALPVIGGLWRINFGIGFNAETPIKLAEQYGDIFTLWAGHIPAVGFSGFEAVKEVLIHHSEDFSDRIQTPMLTTISRGKGIVLSNGHVWKQQRRFGLVTLRKLGVGRKSVESQIEEESQQLVEVFACEKGQPFDPALPITNSICNVICAITFGYRFPLEDETFKKIMDAVAFTLALGLSIFHLLYEIFPWLMKHLPGPHKEALNATEMLLSLAKKEIQKHKEQKSFQEPRDFIDFYLSEIEKRKNDPTFTYDEENLAQDIHDFFIAGTETTATSLKWAILLLANHPDIQDKAYKEIEDVLCSSSFSYQDLKKLPYTNAVLHEIQRLKYPLLFGIPRQTAKDVEIRGFLIPKGIIIIPNIRSVLLDPEHWESPREFNPKHFLDQDGHFVAREEYLAFGAGARVCLGEQLARMEFFIFLVNLLRAFRFQMPPGVKKLNEEPAAGVTTPPHPYKWSRRHFPPGPLALPVIGGLWRVNFGKGYNAETQIKLAEQYGDIFTLWVGHIPAVSFSGFEAVKEVLIHHSEDFSDRVQTPLLTTISRGKGIVLSNGHVWKQQRRFGLVTLRKLGVGRKSVESQIEEESQQLVEVFAREKGQPFDPALPITNSICNVICAITFGYRFPLEDETFKKIMDAVAFTLAFGLSLFHLLYEIFPWLMKHLPGPHKEALNATEMLLSLAKKEIQEHKEQKSFQEPRDFIDFYLSEIEKRKNDPTFTYDDENLAQDIHDFFIAGTETTATSLKWAILLLANHPDIQDKAYKEIEDVLCSSSFIYQDLKKLPYTNAVLHEIQRLKYPLLFGIPRQTAKDVKIRGFLIPKGTIVIPNIRTVLLDPEHWESPNEFNPKHFLDQDGHFVAREEYLAFGAGARVCLGEQLARMEFFIFLVNLMRAFRFQLPPGVKKINEEPRTGLTTPPHPYKVCAVPRCSSLL
nr:PREDICTED: cytochrome P450 2C39 isoform X2 [Anolis carolinensis]|eukprot:XP_016851179.1 PREDICTED: cytochrome P450 2C39 isoform X2 [Anolis carolinensis]